MLVALATANRREYCELQRAKTDALLFLKPRHLCRHFTIRHGGMVACGGQGVGLVHQQGKVALPPSRVFTSPMALYLRGIQDALDGLPKLFGTFLPLAPKRLQQCDDIGRRDILQRFRPDGPRVVFEQIAPPRFGICAAPPACFCSLLCALRLGQRLVGSVCAHL